MMKCSKGPPEISGKKSSLMKKYLMRVPIRVVVRFGELLVRSLTGNNVAYYGNSMGCPTPRHTQQNVPPTRRRSSRPPIMTSPSPSPLPPSEYNRPPAENRSKMISSAKPDQLRRSESAQSLRVRGKVVPAPAALRRHASFGVIERIDEDDEEASSSNRDQ